MGRGESSSKVDLLFARCAFTRSTISRCSVGSAVRALALFEALFEPAEAARAVAQVVHVRRFREARRFRAHRAAVERHVRLAWVWGGDGR